MKFDWIDFGLSWQEDWDKSELDSLLHNSTACLLSQLLRRRDAPFNKVFCWLRRADGVLEAKGDGVRLVEFTFPFTDYDAPGADRLAVFADWLVRAVASGAPELQISNEEVKQLKERLAAEGYVYVRSKKFKRVVGEPRCEIEYVHTPTELVINASCKLADGKTISRSLQEHPFRRDEMVYGGAVTRCIIDKDDKLILETFLGAI